MVTNPTIFDFFDDEQDTVRTKIFTLTVGASVTIGDITVSLDKYYLVAYGDISEELFYSPADAYKYVNGLIGG